MARRGAKLGTSVLDLEVDDSKFNSGLDRSKRKAAAWTSTLGRDIKRGIGQGIGIGGGMAVANAVGGAIDGVKQIVAGSISAAIEWESAFAGVRKTVDASEGEFADLEDEIRGMSKEMPIAATELAGLAEAAGALGVAKDDIGEFTRVTALIGTTTDVSAGDAATSLGQLSNVLGLTGEDYERFASTLVDLGNKGASTESQILEIATRAGAGAALLEMATEETLAWSSAVANLGIEAEAGGSSLQTFFLKSAEAVAEGSDKLDAYARIAGTTASAFKRAFEQDATGALRTFLAGLGELDQGSRLRALSDLGFKDVRITRMLLGLAGNVDNLNDSLEIGSEAWEENSAAADEAATRYGTTESKLIILGNRVNDLAVSFGEKLLPGIVDGATTGVDALDDFVNGFDRGLRNLDILIGDNGAALRTWAHETGEDLVVAQRHMSDFLDQNKDDWEGATQYAIDRMEGVPIAVGEMFRGSIAAWKQADLGGAIREGVPDTSAAANELEEAISKEMAEARDNAVKAMKDMLTGITGLFESDEQVRDAWQGLIDRMDDPYTEAERRATVFSETTIGNIRAALASGDPAIAGDATLLVNNMLAQIALMEPGALESGGLVPPALRSGMDAQMGALIAWVETNVTGETLTAMTLDEANEVGVGGIWSYAMGMRANRLAAVHEAGAVAYSAIVALKQTDQAWAGGYAVGDAWINGITAALWSQNPEVVTAVNYIARNLGGSLPEDGPLKGDTAQHGGQSIGEAWISMLASTIGAGLPDVASAVRGVADTMTVGAGSLMPSLPGLSGLEATMTTGGAGTSVGGSYTDNRQWILNVEGKPLVVGKREDVLDGFDMLGRWAG